MNQTNKLLIQHLVQGGIIKNQVVAKTMERVDRKYFCPSYPYQDSPQLIGYGATISAPHMHAWALELLQHKLSTAQYALDVGSGTGYLTAAMALMVPKSSFVFGIEHVPQLVKNSIQNIKNSLPQLLEQKVKICEGDGRLGWPLNKEIKFDAIHVGAAADKIPSELVQQLAEQGLLIIPVGGQNDVQRFMQITKRDGQLIEKYITSVRYVPLTDLKKQVGK